MKMSPKKVKLSASERRSRFVENCDYIKRIIKNRKKKGASYIYGVDSSLSNPAFVLKDIKGKKSTPVSTITKTTDPHYKRFSEIVENYDKYISQYKPLYMVIEDYSYASKGRKELLGEMRGQIYMLFYKYKLPMFKIAPMQLKKYAGADSKDKIMLEVYRKWKFLPSNDDEADAYVLLRIGMDINKYLFKYYPKVDLSDDRKILEHLKDVPKNFRYKYRWEVAQTVIINKGRLFSELM